MSRKFLKSFAGGIANKFASSAEHFAWLACQHQLSRVTIDLLTLKIEPNAFDIDRNQKLAEMCRRDLLYNIKRLTPPGSVTRAYLTADFRIEGYNEQKRILDGQSVFTVILTDDRGKEWRVDHPVERMLVAP